jgi:hypothetical protein
VERRGAYLPGAGALSFFIELGPEILLGAGAALGAVLVKSLKSFVVLVTGVLPFLECVPLYRFMYMLQLLYCQQPQVFSVLTSFSFT